MTKTLEPHLLQFIPGQGHMYAIFTGLISDQLYITSRYQKGTTGGGGDHIKYQHMLTKM